MGRVSRLWQRGWKLAPGLGAGPGGSVPEGHVWGEEGWGLWGRGQRGCLLSTHRVTGSYRRTFPHQVDAVSHRRLAEGVRPIQGFQSCPLTLLPMMNPQGEDRPPLPQGQLHQAPGTPEAPREVPVLSTAHGPGQTSRGRFSDASAVGDAQSASCTDITRPVLTMSTLCLI